LLLLVFLVPGVPGLCQQPPVSKEEAATAANEQKAHAALDAMIAALGGPRWLALSSAYFEGRTSSFYQGKPTGAVADFFIIRAYPDRERVEFTKKHDVVSIFTGQGDKEAGWEITYKGKRALPDDQVADYFRRRDHSIDTIVHTWLKDPATVFIYDGQRMSERHLTDQVTLISAANDSVVIQMDADTHLPLRRSFQWRDPVYKDKNEEAEEYDDYHTIEGFATPFTTTRFHNGDMTNQRFLYRAHYNVPVTQEMFDPDLAAAHLKH
jgi:hypothetical protein